MKTLYLRNVPDEVVDRLERLAARQGMSVSSVAIRELTEASRRADNARLLSVLPDHGIPPADIVGDMDTDRASR